RRGCVRGIRKDGHHMFTGIHVIEPDFLALLPEGASDIVTDGYLPALSRAAVIGAYVMDGYFWEHSTPERCLEGTVNVVSGVASGERHVGVRRRAADRHGPATRPRSPVMCSTPPAALAAAMSFSAARSRSTSSFAGS